MRASKSYLVRALISGVSFTALILSEGKAAEGTLPATASSVQNQEDLAHESSVAAGSQGKEKAATQSPKDAHLPANGHQNGYADEAALFEQVFGKKAPGAPREGARKLVVPVVIDDKEIGEAFVLLPTDSEAARFDANTLEKAVQDVLQEEHVKPLKSHVDDLGYLTEASFAAAGWRAIFDTAKIAIVLDIPVELRKLQSLTVRSRRPTPVGQRIEPSKASAAVNLSYAQDYMHGLTRNNGRQPSVLNFQGAANLLSVVVEGDFTYFEKAKRRWVRNDVRLVKDWQERAIRFSLGDLAYSTAGFQSAPAIGGISMARNFSIRPYDVVQSSGTASFTLTSESKVEFYVNGQLVMTRNLPAGPHRLDDFPVSSGANDIIVRITDKFGRVEELKIPFFFSSTLLNQGVHQFSYNAGYLMTPKDSVRHYDNKIPVFSMLHSYGFTPWLTAGVNAQGSKKQNQVGLESLFATPIGNFQLRGAASQVKAKNQRGYAGIVQYDVAKGEDRWARNFSMQWATYTKQFSSLGVLTPSNALHHKFSARYSQHLGGGIYGSLSSTYGIFHRGIGRENTQDLSFARNFEEGLSLTMQLGRDKQPKQKVNQRLMFGLRWSIPHTRHSLSADYQSPLNRMMTRWNYSSNGQVGSIGASASVYRQQGQNGGDGSLTYTGNRFLASLSHDVTKARQARMQQRTSLNLRSAVVFADGQVTMSRPITDSFVIVAPQKKLRSKPVKLNSNGENYSAVNDWMGPAVLTDATAYTINNVAIDPSEIPDGYELENDSYYFEPTYRRGGVVKIGSDAVVMLHGRLLDSQGKPLGLVTGEMIPLDEPEARHVIVFTNRTGKFAAEGLKPGTYKVLMYGETFYSTTITIPPEAEGLIDLKEVSLQPEPKKPVVATQEGQP